MHELAIAASLLSRVQMHAERAGASRVAAINLVVGDRAGIVEDALSFSFALLAEGTIAEGARLKVRRTPMRFRCPQCGQAYSPVGIHFRCPVCNIPGEIIDDGTVLTIESLEIDG